ncbi:MAG: hypothetical protein ACYTFY_02505 [Planctomycetota bacterium]
MAKKNYISFKVLFSSLVLISSLLTSEVFIRFFLNMSKNKNKTIYINNSFSGYWRRSNFNFKISSPFKEYKNEYKTDEVGRIIRRNKKIPENSLKILLLGDSLLEGAQVPADKSFSPLLENIMHQNNYKNWYIDDRTISGYSPARMTALFKSLDKKSYKIILIALYIGNDFNDDSRLYHYNRIIFDKFGSILKIKERFDHNRGVMWTSHSGIKKAPWVRKPFYESELLSIIEKSFKRKKGTKLIESNNISINSQHLSDKTSNIKSLEKDFIRNNISSIFKNKFFPEDIEDINRTLSYVKQLVDEAKSSMVTPILLIIPSSYQINSQRKFLLRKCDFLKITPMDLHKIHSKIQKLIIDFSTKENIHYLDLLPILNTSNENLFLEFDNHFNQKGQKFVSEAVYKHLIKNSFIY